MTQESNAKIILLFRPGSYWIKLANWLIFKLFQPFLPTNIR